MTNQQAIEAIHKAASEMPGFHYGDYESFCVDMANCTQAFAVIRTLSPEDCTEVLQAVWARL